MKIKEITLADIECIATDMDSLTDLLRIVIDDAEENRDSPERLRMDVNALNLAYCKLDALAEDLSRAVEHVRAEATP